MMFVLGKVYFVYKLFPLSVRRLRGAERVLSLSPRRLKLKDASRVEKGIGQNNTQLAVCVCLLNLMRDTINYACCFRICIALCVCWRNLFAASLLGT